MNRFVSAGLLVAGCAAAAAAIFLNVTSGRADWAQLGLGLVALVGILASLGPVQRGAQRIIDRSRLESPATLARLRQRPILYLVYACWFAGLFSLGEVVYWLYTTEVSRYRVLGPQFMWSIPLGLFVVFLTIAAGFVALGRRSVSARQLGVFVFVCCFLGFTGWLLMIHAVHQFAAAMLAAGVAVQLSRFLTRHSYLLHQLVRRTLPLILLLVAGIAFRGGVIPIWTEHRAAANLAPATANTPNVLLIVLDTVRAKSLSLYGYERATTPALDRFAGRGVVFERALSTAPWTLPSHGSIFTGRLPREVGGGFMNPLDSSHRTIAESLRDHGYATAGFVANRGYTGAEFGVGRGFDHYEDHDLSLGAALMRTSLGSALATPARRAFGTHENLGQKSAERVNADVLGWMSARERGRPYFVFLNYFDAHAPYLSPDEFSRKFSDTTPNGHVWDKPLDTWSDQEIRELNDAYDGSLAYLDDQLGRLFAELERRGELKDTLVIITSDHGEQFGEHGLMEHSTSLYMPLLHVPLAVVFPGRVPQGARPDTFVSLRDLPATILDLTGLTDQIGFPGQSLARYWNDAPGTPEASKPIVAEVQRVLDAYPDAYPARKGRMGSVILDGRQYIRNYGNEREELYDLNADPEAGIDLIDREPQLAGQFRRHLETAR